MLLLKERATGTIKTLKELCEKVKVLRDAELDPLQSGEKKPFESFSKIFRLNGDELTLLPEK